MDASKSVVVMCSSTLFCTASKQVITYVNLMLVLHAGLRCHSMYGVKGAATSLAKESGLMLKSRPLEITIAPKYGPLP